MKIAILGTRGIPNNYGGFEQFAEFLSVGLAERGHEVTVYNPHFHPYKGTSWHGVRVRHIYSPEEYIGASANFIYDYLCLKDALKSDFDILLECGYHSNAPSYYLLKKDMHAVLITNMDGMEWKRSKWGPATQWLIRKLEKMAVRKSHYLVSDNEGVRQYYQETYQAPSFFIAYGSEVVESFDASCLDDWGLRPYGYHMLIARLEPENNIETILDGYAQSGCSSEPFIVIGNHQTKYGRYLQKKYAAVPGVRFLGSIYNGQLLANMRAFASHYFHGHSVGGTNPSLLEAMGSRTFIAAHDNQFNRAVLKEHALYFRTAADVARIIGETYPDELRESFLAANVRSIIENYTWSHIVEAYEQLFLSVTGTTIPSNS